MNTAGSNGHSHFGVQLDSNFDLSEPVVERKDLRDVQDLWITFTVSECATQPESSVKPEVSESEEHSCQSSKVDSGCSLVQSLPEESLS